MLKAMHRGRLQVFAIVIGIFVVGFFFLPIKEIVVAPPWEIKVIDHAGIPQSKVQVRQVWQDYSFGGSDEKTKFSDSNGDVTFEKISFRVNALSIILATLRDSFRSLNPHASAGHYCFVFCLNAECETLKYTGKELVSKELIVSKRR